MPRQFDAGGRTVLLDWALPARWATVTADGTIDIAGGGIDTLIAPRGSLPTSVEIVIAGRVVAPMDEWLEPGHQLMVVVLDDCSRPVLRRREPLRERNPPARLQPAGRPGRLLVLPQRWRVMVPGVFSVQVHLDDRLQHTYQIDVHEGQ
jgi:hypothetical protein